MAASRLVINIKFAWWYKTIYFPAIQLMSRTFEMPPDWERFEYWTRKAIKVRVIHAISKQ